MTSISTSTVLKRRSILRGDDRLSLNLQDLFAGAADDMDDYNDTHEEEMDQSEELSKDKWIDSVVSSFKEVLIKSKEDIVIGGYAVEKLRGVEANRYRRRALMVFRRLVGIISEKLCPEDPTIMMELHRDSITNNYSHGELDSIRNAILDISLRGRKEISIIAQSILARSIPRKSASELLLEALQRVPEGTMIGRNKSLMGEEKFASLRKTFEVLRRGEMLPKHNYTFRVDGLKLATAISYLQDHLQVKPGALRNVRMDGYTFKSVPVYERGGKTKEDLYKAYKGVTGDSSIGRDTFYDLLVLLSKKGEAKAGLSVYYMNMRYYNEVFQRMMKRVNCFSLKEGSQDVGDQVNGLLEKWRAIYQFICFEYSSLHLKLSDEDRSHCCTYAVSGNEPTRSYAPLSCVKCSACFTYFDKCVRPFLLDCKTKIEDQHSEELQNMIGCLEDLTEVTLYYMAHRVRAKVQQAAIDAIKQQLLTSTEYVLIVMDHKQKVLSMSYREGQVHYYYNTL